MSKKDDTKTDEYADECENHANASDNHAEVGITVNIGGTDFTMEEAERIYYRLKELFEVVVIGSPYPLYPNYPVPSIDPDWVQPLRPYFWEVINICSTEEW